jgi:hypothetical protein
MLLVSSAEAVPGSLYSLVMPSSAISFSFVTELCGSLFDVQHFRSSLWQKLHAGGLEAENFTRLGREPQV